MGLCGTWVIPPWFLYTISKGAELGHTAAKHASISGDFLLSVITHHFPATVQLLHGDLSRWICHMPKHNSGELLEDSQVPTF